MKGKNNTSRSTKEERNRQRKVQRKRAVRTRGKC